VVWNDTKRIYRYSWEVLLPLHNLWGFWGPDTYVLRVDFSCQVKWTLSLKTSHAAKPASFSFSLNSQENSDVMHLSFGFDTCTHCCLWDFKSKWLGTTHQAVIWGEFCLQVDFHALCWKASRVALLCGGCMGNLDSHLVSTMFVFNLPASGVSWLTWLWWGLAKLALLTYWWTCPCKLDT
jgi:hypothetical protein